MSANLLPPTCVSASPVPAVISHYPRIGRFEAGAEVTPSACEKMLTEWFGQPVILLASGRSGLDLYLRAKGFSRYQHRLRVPRYLSRCVMNALTPTVFPVDASQDADGVLFYHQYGFPQRRRPRHATVVEDIAHSFFASTETGVREWAGEVAIFSLPKSFAVAGMAGGVVIRNRAVADKMREMIEGSPAEPPGVREWMRQVIASAYDRDADRSESLFVESAYELLLKFHRPDPRDLAAFPQSLEAICEVGRQRRERVSFFLSYFGPDGFPTDFWDPDEILLPFALPYFSRKGPSALQRINLALDGAGMKAGVYHVDIRRDMDQPDYRPCVLIPCHQNIPMVDFEKMCGIVRAHDRE